MEALQTSTLKVPVKYYVECYDQQFIHQAFQEQQTHQEVFSSC